MNEDKIAYPKDDEDSVAGFHSHDDDDVCSGCGRLHEDCICDDEEDI